MKIFTAAQIRACDAYTIKASGIRSADLMERAATKCAAWLRDHFPKDALFVVLCGPGNNGGDGLAIARMLHQRGFGVKAFLLRISNDLSADCMANLQRLQTIDRSLISVVEPDTFITDIQPNIILIDAMLGTGLSRPITGWIAAFIEHINHLPNRKVAIDIPSGLPPDVLPDAGAAVVRAHDTLSFQFHKRTFLHPESAPYVGHIHLLDIELDQTFINATHTQYRTIEPVFAKSLFHPRRPFAHKGSHGSALLVGGSYGKMGAITLAARAAMRAGAGLVTALIPSCGYSVFQSGAPEAMCRTNGENALERIDGWENKSAVGVGPGLGTDAVTAAGFATFIEECTHPVVLDADALNLLGMQPELLASVPKGSILTPHPKEFARLFGENTNTMIQIDHARIQAMRYNINIVLKGHHTAIITTEGECWYNMTGNAGMAKGGSGDVLTGIITGLLAQHYEPHEAAILGVFLHGLAGDIAARHISQEALLAGDIIEHLGKAFLTFYDN